VFDLGVKLYKLQRSGGSFSQLRSLATTELNNDPSLKQGMMTAASSAARMIGQLSSHKLNVPSSMLNALEHGSSPQPATSSSAQHSSSASFGSMAKLGANLLLAANEAGSNSNPNAGFSSFMSKASKFF